MCHYLDLDSPVGFVGAKFADDDRTRPHHPPGEDVVAFDDVLVLCVPQTLRVVHVVDKLVLLLMLLSRAFLPPRGGSVDEEVL